MTGSGIDCPGDCTQEYAVGTNVQLTAAGIGGTTFTGWGGDCSGATPTCTVAMSVNRSVTATFAQIPSAKRLLSVTADGSGSVTGPGIDCPGDCTQEFDVGSPVSLTASPAPGSSVTWAGDCAVAGAATTCSLTMSDTRSVVARFELDR